MNTTSRTLNREIETKFIGFHDLMQFRVREILLVSSPYDAFVLEEDGRLSERILGEYVDLNLQFVPRITHVKTAAEAIAALAKHNFDLVITMTRLADMDPLVFGRMVKDAYPGKPVVMLTYENMSVDFLARVRQERCIDKVFYWSGNTLILLAIVKFVEDWFNAPLDTRQGVQVILLVEDSPWYYSLFLPTIYTETMRQTRYLITHAVNDLHRMLRMRARPKILMAENYEQAMEICTRYQQNLLAVISDVSFPRGGQIDREAGVAMAEELKQEIPDLPILLQSREPRNEALAAGRAVAFLDKNSPNLLQELRQFILSNCGFGEFVFRFPDGREIGRAATLTQFQQQLAVLPDESLLYHAGRNHFSIWLRARTEFELAEEIRSKKASDFRDAGEIRAYIISCIDRLFTRIQAGVIADFGRSRVDLRNSFIKLGSGSVGGKGRSIAFINALLAGDDIHARYPDVEIKTPHTFILCSDVFEEFMESNRLLDFALAESNDDIVASRFLSAALPQRIEADLLALLEKIHYPLAIRSSSILEDSQMCPFAGLYNTYMIPNNHPDMDVRLRQLIDAVKLVYASVFFSSPKTYIKNVNLRIEDEKMAVLIQEVVGETHGDRRYPTFSGVAQSYNFYPIWHMAPTDGMACLALGLGKAIVNGETVYRFSPAYPRMNPPFSSPAEFVANSQSRFYALNLGNPGQTMERDEDCTYVRCELSTAEHDGVLGHVAGRYSLEEQIIREDLDAGGPRVVTFAPILKYGTFPLSEILRDFFQIGYDAYGAHVEIEFAVKLSTEHGRRSEFNFLQIRPMVAGRENTWVEVSDTLNPAECVCLCAQTMGNGEFTDIFDLLYVDPERFDPAYSKTIAGEIGLLNSALREERRPCILIGFGRFGTADPWLGIPVEWSQMSQARLVIESNLDHFKVEPSHGSHFFHNLIALQLGYFFIKGRGGQEFVDWGWLNSHNAFRSTEYVRHLRFGTPFAVKIDGRHSRGAVFKPGR